MKVLALHCKDLWYRVGRASIASDTSIIGTEWSCKNCALILVHVEPKDAEKPNEYARRLRKFSIWYSRLVDAQPIVLHSFAHLAEEKAAPEDAEKIILAALEGIRKRGFSAHMTPFGYFLELRIHLYDTPSSRIFKNL